MPRIKYCNHRNCQIIVPDKQRYCDKHKPKFDKSKVVTNSIQQSLVNKQAYKSYNDTQRDQELETFYHSLQWKQVRQFVISRDMNTCQVCGDVIQDRKIVDHIHPAKLSPTERLDQSNLWTLCYKCHTAKTRLEQSIKGKHNGDNILKHATKEWWVIAINNQRKHKTKH